CKPSSMVRGRKRRGWLTPISPPESGPDAMLDGSALARDITPFPLSGRGGKAVNAMSVDVEEHFQVQAMAGCIARDAWDAKPSRVVQSTNRVLDLFAAHQAKATFFTLGGVAERHKSLIRRIVDEGHELASHGYEHARADSQT